MPLTARCTAAMALATALIGSALSFAVQAQQPPQGSPQMDLPRTELSAGMHRIHAQVAQTPRQREVGLMYRKEMPTNEGMLFIFDQPATQCFWMKNTVLPLTTAFVADDGTIVNLADMQPMTETSHCSRKPVRYVLEMNQGWFKQKGIAEGTQLRGRPFTAQ
ncbi:MAG: DUF192 domain-containing protein [Comamonas sp.]|jgi:uncharacterized membrane protein (UPF0127 family)